MKDNIKYLSLLQQGDASCKAMIELLSNISELMRGDVSGYARNIGEHALILATALGLKKIEPYYIYYAGLLHEIGLFCVTPKLQKNFVQKKLTASEIILLKQVPKMGYLLLMRIDILQPMANIILYHQEYLNGSGYPKGLKNDEIPFTSKILTVVVDYFKISAGRFFQEKVDSFEAFSYIKKNAGVLYDPKIVDKFSEILSFEKPIKIKNDNLIESKALKSGMILSRNLFSSNGLELFRKGRILSERDVNAILNIENVSNRKLEIYVMDDKAQNYNDPFSSKDLDLREISILLNDNIDLNNL